MDKTKEIAIYSALISYLKKKKGDIFFLVKQHIVTVAYKHYTSLLTGMIRSLHWKVIRIVSKDQHYDNPRPGTHHGK